MQNTIEETKDDAHKMYKSVKIIKTGTTKRMAIQRGKVLDIRRQKCEEITKWVEENI